jgi:small subunit ribosomal protein S16
VLKIRLRRMGAKKKPTYRVVVAESTAPRDGVYVEMLGLYNPRTEPSTFQVDAEKTRDWLRKGAQPTDRVARLLAKTGITAA